MIEFYWSGQQVAHSPTESPGAWRWSEGSSFTTPRWRAALGERKERAEEKTPILETEVPLQIYDLTV